MTETFGGLTPAEWFGAIASMLDSVVGQSSNRPPDARHDLTQKLPGTVVSVQDDSVDVRLDADAPTDPIHCAPGAAASPEQRGNVLMSPSGSAVWIGGSPVEAGGAGPTQLPPATPYVCVGPNSVPLIGNGVLDGVYTNLPGTPLVWFSIELLFGTTTHVPTFVLPSLPAPRRQNFSGYLVKQPSTIRTPLYPYSSFDGSGVGLTIDCWNGALNPDLLTDIFPGSLNGGASRISLTGVYEAQQ